MGSLMSGYAALEQPDHGTAGSWIPRASVILECVQLVKQSALVVPAQDSSAWPHYMDSVPPEFHFVPLKWRVALFPSLPAGFPGQ